MTDAKDGQTVDGRQHGEGQLTTGPFLICPSAVLIPSERLDRTTREPARRQVARQIPTGPWRPTSPRNVAASIAATRTKAREGPGREHRDNDTDHHPTDQHPGAPARHTILPNWPAFLAPSAIRTPISWSRSANT